MDAFQSAIVVISSLGTFGGVFAFYYNIRKRFESMESRGNARKEENKLIIGALFACLDGLHQLNCNDVVTQCREDLQKYLIKSRE